MEWIPVLGLFGLCVLSSAQHFGDDGHFEPHESASTPSPGRAASYLLLAPSEACPGRPFSLSVSILTSYPEVRVTCQLYAKNLSMSSTSTSIRGGSSALVNLSVPNPLEDRTLELRVQGYVGGELLFRDSTRLAVRAREVSSFIQTDKPTYRPGDRVGIRVVSVGADREPHQGPVDLFIKDPKGNLIRQWLSLNTTLGVANQTLQLSDHPPLGRWAIQTTVHEEQSVNYFDVAHYVLPKFGVQISAPSVWYYMDLLNGSVTARFSYGKPVRGEMVVSCLHAGGVVASTGPTAIEGKADFELDLQRSQLNTHLENEDRTLRLLVNVTESLTGLMYSSEASVHMALSQYKITFECTPFALRPSLNFTAKLRISSYDGRPLTPHDQAKTVLVDVAQHRSTPWYALYQPRDNKPTSSAWQRMQLPVPADGVIPLSIHIIHDIQTLEIDAWLDDSYEMLLLESKYRSPSQSYLQIQKPTTPAQVGRPFLLRVDSNFGTALSFYIVKSRDRIVESGSFSGPLALTPAASWAPMACLVVYCILPSGEVVNDVLLVPVPLELQNQVSVSWSEDQSRPAETVALRLSVSEPRSLVGILVVDTATHRSDSRNDITAERVLKELYGDTSGGHQSEYWGRLGDPESLFESCDLMVLTDAQLNRVPPKYELFQIAEGGMLMKDDEEEEEVQEEPRVRRNFPETWLWMTISMGGENTWEIPVIVPDSITTWRATAFTVSEHLGLGVVDTPALLTVFQDFFLSLNLPACIIRGEELVLEVNVYNYLSMDLQVMVTVAESDAFEFVFGGFMAGSRQVLVPGHGGGQLMFPIRPLVLGPMPISVKATSSAADDAVERSVLVKAEGLEQSYSTTLLVELSSLNQSFTRQLEFLFPSDVVEGSQRAAVTVVGDLLGPSINGLESLIQMPYGCGEQNMIHFAPNIYVLQYLEASGQNAQDIVVKALDYMEKGYERELSYQRQDGSFSAFGESDSSGSTWLSAFVLRCFFQARRFIPIDPSVLNRTAQWLTLQQGADGRFLEPGRVIHTELQGGLDGPAALTAYVLTALLQDQVQSPYSSQVSRALQYLETSLDLGISSNYGLSLVTYALALSGSAKASSAWATLVGRAQVTDGVPFWTSSGAGLARSWQPPTADIEMAAYALLSLQRLGRFEEGIPIMKWLSQQRNHLGGYGSTQDTVVALQALSTSVLATASSLDLTITVGVPDAMATVPRATFELDYTNYMVQQSEQVEADGDILLQVEAQGIGIALLQFNVFYNVDSTGLERRRRREEDQEAFQLDLELSDYGESTAHLSLCFRLVDQQDLDRTGMALLEVGLLSGFSLAQDGVQAHDNIRKVEEEPGKVVVYLDSVGRAEQCVEVALLVEHMVARVQHASVVLLDYYEPRRRTVRSYTSYFRQSVDPCALCGRDCHQCGDPSYGFLTDAAAAAAARPLLLLLLPCPLLLLLGG